MHVVTSETLKTLAIHPFIDEIWCAGFTDLYSGKMAEVVVEDWLEQPNDDTIDTVAYELKEAGPNYQDPDGGWYRRISGTVQGAFEVDVRHYTDTRHTRVLALADARLQNLDGSSELLAEGRSVLVRLDRIKDRLFSIER